jgi:hypothetical protein
MLIKTHFSPSAEPAILADVKIELIADFGDSITINHACILLHQQGQLSVLMPLYRLYSDPAGHRYDNQPALILSESLKRSVEDAVFQAFFDWEFDRKCDENIGPEPNKEKGQADHES